MADARVSVLIDIRSKMAQLDRATRGFQNLLKGVLAATAAYVSFRSVAGGIRQIVSLGSNLQHLSLQTGIAVGGLTTLRQAFQDNGIAPERVGKAVNDLQKRIADAARGMGEGRNALRDLNLEAAEVARMSPADQFQLIGERIAGVENPAQRSAIAMKLLGKSGTELMPLFASGGAIDDARQSLGQLPVILERNAAQFERIETLVGRLPNKSRQLFAGLGDQLAGYLTGPLEALNRMDFTGLGQRIGAFIAVGLESIKDGSFSQFISLAIQAGFEQGLGGARRMMDSFGTDTGWLKPIATAAMTIGVEFGKLASDALGFVSLFSAYLTSGFTFAFEKGREGWGALMGIIKDGLVSIVNFFASRLESVLNTAIEWANKIPGVTIATATIGRVEGNAERNTFTGRSYGDILQESQLAVVERADSRRTALQSNLQESLRIIGAQTEATDQQVSASERLNELIAERIRLRDQATESTASTSSLATGSEFSAIAQTTFADKSRERFDQFSTGQGDFGVDTWTAAKAALMDYVTTVGTVAQQVYSAIGSIASAMTQGISQSITGLINGTMELSDALRNIGATIVNSVITAFSDMAAQWIVKRTMMFILGRKLDTAEVASNMAKNTAIAATETTTAGITAAAWTPAALVKSIATFGVAAIIGLALFAAALSSFDTGGFTGSGNPKAPAGIVHKGEFVMPADVVSKQGPGYFYALMASIRSTGATPQSGAAMMDSLRFNSPAMPLARYASGGLVGADSAPGASHIERILPTANPGTDQPQKPIRFVMVDSRKDGERLRGDPDFETYIVDIARRNRGELFS